MLKAMNAHGPTHHAIKVIRRCNQLSWLLFQGETKLPRFKAAMGNHVPWVQQVITLISSFCQLGGMLISEIAPRRVWLE